MKYCSLFFIILLLCGGFVKSSALILNPENWYIRGVPRDSGRYYMEIMNCLDSLEKLDSSIDYMKNAKVCGGIFVLAILEDQSCPPASKGKQQLCTSRYRVVATLIPDLGTIDAFKRTFGEYLEIKEYPVASEHRRWTVIIYVSDTKNKIRVWSRSCWGDDCPYSCNNVIKYHR